MLTETMQSCSGLACYLDALKSAGLPVEEWQAGNDRRANLATKLKAIHFPDRS